MHMPTYVYNKVIGIGNWPKAKDSISNNKEIYLFF